MDVETLAAAVKLAKKKVLPETTAGDAGDVLTVDSEGNSRMKRWLPLGLTADERVCSGAHYAKFFADAIKNFGNPELLEQPPEQVFFDEGVEYHVPKVKK